MTPIVSGNRGPMYASQEGTSDLLRLMTSARDIAEIADAIATGNVPAGEVLRSAVETIRVSCSVGVRLCDDILDHLPHDPA